VGAQSKREEWFRAGTAVTNELFDDADGRYLCPLCLRWFDHWSSLSREHAPPQSVGGHRVALTCTDCNSGAGSSIDAQLRRAENIREFASRAMGQAIPATFSVEGITLRVEMQFGPDGLTIVGVPKQNHPEITAAQTALFERLAAQGHWDGTTLQVTFAGANFRAAAVGWLRSAYLVAFAALGYRYILRPELNVVRQQISEPTEHHLERFCLMVGGGTVGRERRILLVNRPRSLESVAVFSNECVTFLPGFGRGANIYEQLALRKRWPPRGGDLAGKEVPWPTGPSFMFDRRPTP